MPPTLPKRAVGMGVLRASNDFAGLSVEPGGRYSMAKGLDVTQLMALVDGLQKMAPMLQVLAALGGGQVQVPKAQAKAKVQRPPKPRPEPRVLSSEAAKVAAELLLTVGVPGSEGVFQGTYTNAKGYHSLKTFRVLDEKWANSAGEPGIIARLCFPDGSLVPERQYSDKNGALKTDDQKRCLVLAAFSNLKKV